DREGKLTALAGKPAGRLVVFRPEDNQSPYKKETQITEDLAEQGSLSIHNPDHIRMYFNRIYEGDRDPENIEGLRKKLDYPAVAERFAMINDRTKAIMVPFDSEARDLIERIEKTGGQDYDLLRQAQRYQVGLYSKEFDKAREYGTIVELWQGSDLWKCHPSCYLDSVGLVIKALEPEEYMA
ncbi:MAG: CRISPR-associated endonuclease Cas3'', partial [Bacillota bacterium]|nr:CRISPR-associated endonuclease Cas3'' [Bacillota bacterium]